MSKKKMYTSLTTEKKVNMETYLIELAIIRDQRGQVPPPSFWNLNKYKWRFGREIKALRKFVKSYGAAAVYEVCTKNYLTTYTDYAAMEFHLQSIIARYKRLAQPKDISEAKLPEKQELSDLRGETKKNNKKGLFERLMEMKNERI